MLVIVIVLPSSFTLSLSSCARVMSVCPIVVRYLEAMHVYVRNKLMKPEAFSLHLSTIDMYTNHV